MRSRTDASMAKGELPGVLLGIVNEILEPLERALLIDHQQSGATPCGPQNECVNANRKLTVGVNTCMRLFCESATYIFPVLSTATPDGTLNWPSPEPAVPTANWNVPLASNTCMRLVFESATYMIPVLPTATPHG